MNAAGSLSNTTTMSARATSAAVSGCSGSAFGLIRSAPSAADSSGAICSSGVIPRATNSTASRAQRRLDADGALLALGEIVHDLDIADAKFEQPETAGLGALIGGICAATQDDTERLAQGS